MAVSTLAHMGLLVLHIPILAYFTFILLSVAKQVLDNPNNPDNPDSPDSPNNPNNPDNPDSPDIYMFIYLYFPFLFFILINSPLHLSLTPLE